MIPFKGQVQFIPGYRGLMKLARQGGVHFDVPRDVHEGDHFEYSFGMNETLCHRPIAAIRTEKTMTHVYVKATTPDGVVRFDVMTKAEVDAVRERSKSKSNGPWVTDYLAMAKKTVIRRISKYLPCSEELHQAVADDEAAERGEQVSFRELDLIEPEDDTAEVTA